METQVILLRETASALELANNAIEAVVNGEVDPITAHINICRMEQAIKLYKDNDRVRDITLRELSKYGKAHQFGDCRLEEAEVGTKYDYTSCADSRYTEMVKLRETLDIDIKDREKMLKNLPHSGMADPETGELLFPPSKTSKTSIKTTFKK